MEKNSFEEAENENMLIHNTGYKMSVCRWGLRIL